MEINERIKFLRKETLNSTQEDFANKIFISRANLGSIEVGRINVTDRVIQDICREFNVSEKWLRHGQGEMFNKIPEEDEIATYVSQLLEDEGNNAFNTMIIEIMRTYNELEPSSQEIVKESCSKLIENLGKKKEG